MLRLFVEFKGYETGGPVHRHVEWHDNMVFSLTHAPLCGAMGMSHSLASLVSARQPLSSFSSRAALEVLS